MREENRAAGEALIIDATYRLLDEKGYHGCSMLSIAKQAKASNETMYKWYGDKVGLFRVLVARNAKEVTDLLKTQLNQRDTGIATLHRVGPVLLKLLVSEQAIALNRAAASDQKGNLGKALSLAGRETVFTLLSNVFKAAKKNNELQFLKVDEAVGLYLDLLVGDTQIRRATRSMSEPSSKWISQRASIAVERLLILLDTR